MILVMLFYQHIRIFSVNKVLLPNFILVHIANNPTPVGYSVQPTFHLYNKGEKTSEVVGADVNKLQSAMESLHK
jgi:hypothetical protein